MQKQDIFYIGTSKGNLKQYNLFIKKFTPKFSVLDGSKSGRAQSTGNMTRQIIGTYYNCELEIKTTEATKADVEKLVHMLIQPRASYWFKIPFFQKTIVQEMYCVSLDRELLLHYQDGRKYKNQYGNFTISLVAMKRLTKSQLDNAISNL